MASDPAVTPKPFLRWPGGKRRLAGSIIKCFPPHFHRYFEVFLGSGALFFEVRPYPAQLSDTNKDLIATFRTVRDDVEKLISWLSRQPQSENRFNHVRSWNPTSDLDRARRLLYLNRSAFNGVWRVNRKGEFNVPYGHRPRADLVGAGLLRAASTALKGRSIAHADFETALDRVEPGDLVYADPPYTVQHANNGFRRYNERLFAWSDQIRLARRLQELAGRGAFVVVSNAVNPEVRELYAGFSTRIVQRQSPIAGKPSARGLFAEAIYFTSGG